MLVKNSISLKLNSATTKNNPLIWKIIAKAMLSPAKTLFYGNWKDITLPYQQQNEEHENHNN